MKYTELTKRFSKFEFFTTLQIELRSRPNCLEAATERLECWRELFAEMPARKQPRSCTQSVIQKYRKTLVKTTKQYYHITWMLSTKAEIISARTVLAFGLSVWLGFNQIQKACLEKKPFPASRQFDKSCQLYFRCVVVLHIVHLPIRLFYYKSLLQRNSLSSRYKSTEKKVKKCFYGTTKLGDKCLRKLKTKHHFWPTDVRTHAAGISKIKREHCWEMGLHKALYGALIEVLILPILPTIVNTQPRRETY